MIRRAVVMGLAPTSALVIAYLGGLFDASSANLIGTSQPAIQIAPWTAPRLKATAGLLLWLEVGRQSAARKAHGRPDLADGGRKRGSPQ